MNKSAFLKLIQQASNISDQQTEELEKMAVAFPYCQTAHLLLAKSAYDKGSMLSAQRLRRAASYATNRQLLKRVIYTSSAIPVFEEAEPEELKDAQVVATTLPEHPDTDVQEQEAASVTIELTPVTHAFSPALHDDQHEEIPVEEEYQEAKVVDASASVVSIDTTAERETEESELLSLLTISSLSPSFTDLLAQEPDPETEITTPFPFQQYHHAAEEHAPKIEENAVPEHDELIAHPEPHFVAPEIFTEEEHALLIEAQQPEDAAIKYATDEIDRLYAEDALGYWMGSSRMGELLQLKDEYTRPKPQSFHPELILEYNKTHELEKAIQPATNLLSGQLDIIEQFLKLNPRLKTMANLKIKEEPQEDLSLKSTKIKKSMASENLAIIFIKQGKIKKAVKIYEQLILKNPEKKTYFAEQIEKLQNQI